MLKTSLHFAWRGFGHVTRFAIRLGVLLLFACAMALLTLRYWILPDVERYHDEIILSVSHAIGQPLTIGRIEADWHGLRPHLLLVNVRFLDRQGRPALVLDKVEAELAWTTLLSRELRLNSLVLDQPDLLVRRDVRGDLFVAGVQLSDAGTGNSGADWLLNQSYLVVKDARIIWLDELRKAPKLTFNEVNLVIDNGWRRHRFALRALPPDELSGQVDLRGDFHGTSFDDPGAWGGQMFAQLDYADVAAWRTWVPLPVPLTHGKGALRSWVDVEQGKLSRVTADLALSGVVTRLDETVPALGLRQLRGRIGWHELEEGAEFFTRQFSLRLNDGFVLPPTDFSLRLIRGQGKQGGSGEVGANKLDMAALTKLSKFVPFDIELKQKLEDFSPHGKISELRAKWWGGESLHYELKARFDNLSAHQVGDVPGFSGLSGEVDGSDASGKLTLKSRKLAVDAAAFMQEALLFDSVTAEVGWKKDRRGMEVTLDKVFIENADLSGSLSGSYHTLANSPGEVDLSAHLTRAAVRRVDRYIPIKALGQGAHAWLKTGLVGGRSDEVNMSLHGDLKDFPFPENKQGVFRIQAHIKDATVEYHNDWPRMEDVNGELLIEGRRIEVNVPTANTAGNRLQRVSVVFPDLSAPNLPLHITGEVVGEMSRALDFVQKSPVRGYIGGFTDAASARGDGMLDLLLDISLLGDKRVKVQGAYHFLGNEVDLGGRVPLLRDTRGDLRFTESSVQTQGLTAQVLGGPAEIEVRSDADHTVRVTAKGRADLDALRSISSQRVLQYLHGSTLWELGVVSRNKQTELVITSNLSGLASDLPAPLYKRAEEAMLLRVENKFLGSQQELWSLQYGKLLGAKLLRKQEADAWKIRRGTVYFGKPGKWLERDGIWISGVLPEVSLEGWGALREFAQPPKEGSGGGLPPINGADLLIQKMMGYGQTINNLHVNVHTHLDTLIAQLAAQEINGELIWQPQGEGALVVRLKNLSLAEFAAPKQLEMKKEAAAAPETAGGSESPEFHIAVDSLSYKAKPLGRLELQAKRRAGNWLVERMQLTNSDGMLTADGKWLAAGGAAQTQVGFKLEIHDAGKMLSRSGYPDAVKNAGGKLEGNLAWHGGPAEFGYATLEGALKLDVGKGQFLKIEPGVGKLLGILSLQALPKRISLDFTDVFSDGFAFDNISGTAQIQHGLMTTNDFKINGPAAKVTMSGLVDLNHETQNLHVHILPEVGTGVSLLGAFAAGPVVGVGVLLADKLLQNPLEKLVSFEYNVTGTWADPSVTKAGTSKPVK